jgi:hypothetical protein
MVRLHLRAPTTVNNFSEAFNSMQGLPVKHSMTIRTNNRQFIKADFMFLLQLSERNAMVTFCEPIAE